MSVVRRRLARAMSSSSTPASSVVARASVRVRAPPTLVNRFSSLSGSGALCRDDDGRVMIVTCAHVARLAGRQNAVEATFHDGARERGRVVGVHASLDLALVALDDEAVRERVREWSLTVDDDEDVSAGDDVLAAGTPQAYAYAAAFARGVRVDGVSRGRVLGTHGGTHAMHDATVVSGQSGGPLCRVAAPGRLLGVHSFGDAFYGGARDVAVLATNVRDIEIFEKGVDPDAYEMRRVNAMIFASSDEALRALAPELTAKERAAWIF